MKVPWWEQSPVKASMLIIASLYVAFTLARYGLNRYDALAAQVASAAAPNATTAPAAGLVNSSKLPSNFSQRAQTVASSNGTILTIVVLIVIGKLTKFSKANAKCL